MKNEIKVSYIDLAEQNSTIKNELLKAVELVLSHGQFILGPEVKDFEKQFAKYCKAKYAVGVNNGTSALYLTMRCLGIGPGDEVITAPNSFLSSASSIALTGAKPVFVDVRDDFNMDPALLESAITPKTKAIIPVHLTGRPADMDPIIATARRHGLHVIEDCAQAVGARYREQRVGSFGVAGCFSMHPLKTLNAIGDGGIITTSDSKLFEKLVQARNHGLRSRDECVFWSHNCRLDTIQAAMLSVKMNYLDKWTESRRAHAAFYRDHLRDLLQVPEEKPFEYSVYHTFVVQAEKRHELRQYLLEHGVDTKIHYPIPIHLQRAARYLGYKLGSFPTVERQANRILSLPIYPELKSWQLEYVAEVIKLFSQQGNS